jgi:hypothetical protein
VKHRYVVGALRVANCSPNLALDVNTVAWATAIFAKQKPRGVERGGGGDPNLNRERNGYENRCCSNDE